MTSNLPKQGAYPLRIVDVEYLKDKLQFDGTTRKDEVVLKMELIGTKNTEYEDTPFQVRLYGIREGSLLYGPEAESLSNAAKILVALGADKKQLSYKRMSQINWPAVKGLYLHGYIQHKEGKDKEGNPKTFLTTKVPQIFPTDSQDHAETNLQRIPDILNAPVYN